MRVRNAPGFRAAYDAGVSVRTGPLVVYACPAPPGVVDGPRLGLSVPRRVGNAVRRNRVKRRLREAFRLERPDLPRGYDLVVNVRPHVPLTVPEYRQRLMRAAETLDQRWTKRLRAREPDEPSEPDGRPGR
ncbi:MAG: ribonuclease P protein component [Phycisphaerales bacterium]|nr:ribonuclease P protein component [Phycisphaerae bacterium]NNF44056.1 ribonuclease P protein component [Phycisphaerales bacterium]NNM26153.1 ribonuclease P protein component [Phycisphaerales bacterium]